jgi:hypothetical protein
MTPFYLPMRSGISAQHTISSDGMYPDTVCSALPSPRAQNTMRNCGAPSPVAGTSSQRHGSSSSDTGQYPASVNAAPDSAADPNSKTVASDASRCSRRTSNAPCAPDDAAAPVAAGVGWLRCFVEPPLHHEKNPIGRKTENPVGLGSALGRTTDFRPVWFEGKM